jgi:hypothetical protein
VHRLLKAKSLRGPAEGVPRLEAMVTLSAGKGSVLLGTACTKRTQGHGSVNSNTVLKATTQK